jgi:hypothetical protein
LKPAQRKLITWAEKNGKNGLGFRVEGLGLST